MVLAYGCALGETMSRFKENRKMPAFEVSYKSSSRSHTGATYASWLVGQLAGFQPLTVAREGMCIN